MQRTLSVLRNFVALCKKHSADEFLAVATAAVRDAENGKAFLAEITKQTGIVFYSISGLEEARLIYKGVSQDFPVSDTLRFYVSDTGNSAIRLVKNGTVRTLVVRDVENLESFSPVSPVGIILVENELYICDNFSRKVFVLPLI